MSKELYGTSIYLDIYDDCINICWGNKDKFIEYCKSNDIYYGERLEDDNTVDGICLREEDGSVHVWVKDFKNKNTVVHELTHAIMNICCNRNIVLSSTYGEQETACYLFGYVIGKALDLKEKDCHIRKNNKWVKQK